MLPSMAQAIGFGEMISQSAIGEPFRAEFKLFGVGANEDASCLKVVATNSSDGIPELRNAQVRIEGRGESRVAVVTRRIPVSDPIVRVTLEEMCSARLQRSYTLLLPMAAAVTGPSVRQTTRAAAAPAPAQEAPAAPLSANDLGSAYTLSHARSINQLARELFPRSRADRAAFVAALRSANTGDRSLRSTSRRLAAGTTLVLPSRGEIDAARATLAARAETRAPAPVTTPQAPPPPATTPTPTPEDTEQTQGNVAETPVEPTRQDRLVLGGESPEVSGFKLSTRLGNPGLVDSTTDAERDVLRREQQLIMALDAQTMARMELSSRIERLEALRDALKAEMEGTTPVAADAATQNQPPTDSAAAHEGTPAPTPAPASPAVISVPVAPPSPATVLPEAPAMEISMTWWPAAAAGVALLLLGALWWRRKRSTAGYEDISEDEEPTPVSSLPLVTAPVVTEREPEALPGQGDSFDFSVIEWEGPPPAELDHSISPIALEEEEMAEEHESAVELADIMMSFGRVQGAAETLAEFIRGNPKKAVQPWIKLLEVYKAANMRAEFDALTHKLNQTFNVKTVTWERFDEIKKAPDSVEQMPHIINSLKAQWMTVDCQRYLQMLLRDNRGGTREGFALGVVDDLLMLQAVLEDLLGPYRPTEEEIAKALGGNADNDAKVREGDANGFVAPPSELAPDLSFDEKAKALPSNAINEEDIFDLDGPNARTELPDLDFQLDTDFLTPEEVGGDAPENADKGEDEAEETPDTAMRATWVLPKSQNED